jgi:hypothetical protein
VNKGRGDSLHLIEDDSLSLKDIGNYLEEEFDEGTLYLKVH